MTGNPSQGRAAQPTAMLEWREEGLYCPPAGLYIDPIRKVARAVITHAHSDHARKGHGHYACHHDSVPLLRHRLGKKIRVEGFEYGQGFTENGVKLSFHPSGHMTGAAMVRLEYRGEAWVVTGDFKTMDDGLNVPWAPVRCHGLVMESTFALPIYRWRPQAEVAAEMAAWQRLNRSRGMLSVVSAYPLGKAQRLMHLLAGSGIGTALHPVIAEATAAVRSTGVGLPEAMVLHQQSNPEDLLDRVLLLPAMARDHAWLARLGPVSSAAASGWARIRAMRSRQGADAAFVLSDHADWDGLNLAVEACGAEKVVVAHGYEAPFAAWLHARGLECWTEAELMHGEGHHTNTETINPEGGLE